jgi:hypothetical protein
MVDLSNAYIYKIRFVVRWDSNVLADELEWKIDDLAIYNISKVPNSDLSSYRTIPYAGEAIKAGIRRRLDGQIRIHRIALSQFKFGTSQGKGVPAHISDLSGQAGANPTTISELHKGKFAMQDFNGNIVSTFIPKGGVKRERNVSIIGQTVLKEAIADLDQSSTPFSVIDPQSDFADFIISPGSMSWTVIDAQEKVRFIKGAIQFDEAANYLWNGKFILKEA